MVCEFSNDGENNGDCPIGDGCGGGRSGGRVKPHQGCSSTAGSSRQRKDRTDSQGTARALEPEEMQLA